MHKLFLTLFPLSIFLSLSCPVHALDGTWQLIKFRRWAMNHFNSVSFPDPGNGWIGGTALYRTRDGGLTWEKIMGAPSDPEVRDVVFIDENKGWIAAGANGLLVTDDGGSVWKSVSAEMPEGNVNSVFFVDVLMTIWFLPPGTPEEPGPMLRRPSLRKRMHFLIRCFTIPILTGNGCGLT